MPFRDQGRVAAAWLSPPRAVAAVLDPTRDLGDDPVRRIEELRGHGGPASEAEVGDLEDAVRRREALLELREDGRIDRPCASTSSE